MKAKRVNRETLLRQRKSTKTDNKVRMIFTHNESNPPINQWIRESKKYLVKNDQAKQMGENIQVGWKQPKNLKRTVCGINKVGAKRPPPSENPGCSKCGHCKVSCPILQEGRYFQSTNNAKRYNIKSQLNCDSSFLIYLATCQRCSGQYMVNPKQNSKPDIKTTKER